MEEGETLEEIEEDSEQKYAPLQPLAYDHGVSLIPLPKSPNSKDFVISHHDLQVILKKMYKSLFHFYINMLFPFNVLIEYLLLT